jgi:hypothetical protein
MTYNKPEVRLLGEAGEVIRSEKPETPGTDTASGYTLDPGYQLDE